MVNPIYQQDEELLLNPFGSKYLGATEHTNVNSNEFVVQEDAVISLLTGGDASITENNIDYKASMNLSNVTLKKGALIVAPVGEAFKSITIDSGAIMAYNCVVEGDKPTLFSFGNALKFDGVNDQVNFTNADTVDSLSSMSINLWTKENNFALGSLKASNNRFWFVYNSSSSQPVIAAFRTDLQGDARVTSANFPTLNTNNMYTVIYDGNNAVANDTIRIYVNGVRLNATVSNVPTSLNSDVLQAFQIGAIFANRANGKINEFALEVNQVLSDSDITGLYNSGNGANYDTATSRTPYIYCKMNEEDGATTALNEGTLGVDGNLAGFTTPPAYFVPFNS